MTSHHRKPALAAAFVCLLAAGATAAAAETTSRGFRRGFPAAGKVRLANLAGRIELVPIKGSEIVVETTVHAEGRDAAETRKLLDGMQWVKEHDKKGREEWVLTYPVDDYDGFAYPRKGHQVEILGIDFGHTSSTYRGERVRIYASRRSSVPILYANLKIGMPHDAELAVRNVVGAVRGGALQGDLLVDTGSGDVQLAAFAGALVVDTGSGDVTLGSTRARLPSTPAPATSPSSSGWATAPWTPAPATSRSPRSRPASSRWTPAPATSWSAAAPSPHSPPTPARARSGSSASRSRSWPPTPARGT